MSETLSQDPESLGSGYSLAQSYPPTPATPSSTVQDAPAGSNLPPFSTFSTDIDAGSGFGSDRLFSDARLLDISNWEYYGETRLLDRGENGLSIISSQPQYRPWESKPVDSTSQESLRQSFATTTPITTFADAFTQNGVPKLPSFQSQFQTFNEPVTTTEPTLTTLTNLTPVSPNSSSPGNHSLTTLNTNFHTLSAVNTRNYPLVPAPIQAREIPSIQQQFLDERHIQLYTHPTTNLALNNTIHSASIFPAQNGALIQNSQLIGSPTVVTVLKSEPVTELKLGTLTALSDSGMKIQNISLHPTQFQNPMSSVLDNNGLYNGLDKKLNGINTGMDSPTRNDFRKKERRKMRASSLESSAESDGASSNMEISSENSGQVASVSSTAGFKTSHHSLAANSGMEADEISGGNADKQVKKKRKRCGECIGCQRKDNCGDCAPCRNDKSHQICKQRRCEKLTEKKLYGDEAFIRGESRRGRGKGRGAGSYRGRKPSGPVTLPASSSVPEPAAPLPSRPSPQPVHMLKPEQPVQQQPMAPMPFYADPNRFPTPVWQADPTQGWPQGQFIQQIPAATQAPLEGYTQQYPNGIYQTTYQQPGFESNTFYTGTVQVLTRPPSAPNQSQLTPRPNGSYSHTPSPVPAQSQQNSQRTNISGQYHQEYVSNNQNYVTPATTPTGNIDNNQGAGISRPSSVNSNQSNNQNFQTQNSGNFTPVSSTNFSPSSNTPPHFSNSNTNSGNVKPGYPPVSSHPQLASHNSSGGYPGNDYSGQNLLSPQSQNEQHWQSNSDSNSIWEQNVLHQGNESAKSDQIELHKYAQMQHDQQMEKRQEYLLVQNQLQMSSEQQFSQADRVNLNSRLKTMILNKQQNAGGKSGDQQKVEQNTTGHFLSYSHHRRTDLGGDGGVHVQPKLDKHPMKSNGFRKSLPPLYIPNQRGTAFLENEFRKQPANFLPQIKLPEQGFQNENYFEENRLKPRNGYNVAASPTQQFPSFKDSFGTKNCYAKNFEALWSQDSPSVYNLGYERGFKTQLLNKYMKENKNSLENHESNDKIKTNVGLEIPACNCFPPDRLPPEPGSYYTHLGCSSSLPNLRKDLETRTGVSGMAIRIEKVCYTGKEGKTPQGCPLAKWIIRRSNYDEKYLVIVKHRRGHFCPSAFIVVCIVAWEGISTNEADDLYSMLTQKLNQFGLPTSRRCATNEPRTCACQGLEPENCGASFSFGCSWSMYYNGCKYARSKIIRKFRLTVRPEEDMLEERLQALSTFLSPLYQTLAPASFKNQCEFEEQASDCRLGSTNGRPFSGVTACLDFCAHAHRDSHNMNNGCTVVVTLTKHREITKPEDEQLHVLPLYVVDESDEFGSKEHQDEKVLNGSIEVLHKFQCEVRVRTVPLQPCRRNNAKKRKEEEQQHKDSSIKKENSSAKSASISPAAVFSNMNYNDSLVQSSQVSSTVLDSPGSYSSWRYDANLYASPSYQQYINDGQSSFYSPEKNSWFGQNSFNARKNLNEVYDGVMKTDPDSTTALEKKYLSNTLNPVLDNKQSYNALNMTYQHKVNIRETQPQDLSTKATNPYNNFDYYQQPQVQNGFKVPRIPATELDFSHFSSDEPTMYSSGFSNYDSYKILNPFDDLFCSVPKPNYFDVPKFAQPPTPPLPPDLPKPLGEVTEVIDNFESFKDSQVGGVAIALGHGSVLFECAKHELHATTALKKPNRKSPTRISLVFYQHRNMNKSKHGWDEWEEKMRLRKLGVTNNTNTDAGDIKVNVEANDKPNDLTEVVAAGSNFVKEIMLRAPTLTTMSVTTLFPMYPCIVTGPYQESGTVG